MKKFTIMLILALCYFNLFAQGFNFSATDEGFSMTVTGDDNVKKTTTVKNSGDVTDQIAEKLEALQVKYITKLNKLDGKRANNLIDEIYSLLALLPENSTLVKPQVSGNHQTESSSTTVNINVSGFETQAPPTEVVKPVVPTNSKQGMSDPDFSKLVQRIKDESFSDDQLIVIRTAAKKNNFKVNQIVRILDCFSFASDKVSALEIAYPGCLDPQNNFEILKAFTYSDDKVEAERIIDAN